MTKLEWKELPKVDSMSPFWWGSSWLFYQFERDKAVMHDENDDNIRTAKQLVSKNEFFQDSFFFAMLWETNEFVKSFLKGSFLCSICSLSTVFGFLKKKNFWGSRSSRRFSEILTLFPFIWIAIMLNRCSSIFKVINQPFWPLFWLLLLLMALAAEEAYIFVIKPPFLSPCFALCTNLITLSRGCVLHFGLLCNATCPHKKSGKYIIQHIEKRGWMVIENRYRQ